MEQNDAELIQRILQGDQDALDPLVRKYQKGVHALVWRKIGDFISHKRLHRTLFSMPIGTQDLEKPEPIRRVLYVIAATYLATGSEGNVYLWNP